MIVNLKVKSFIKTQYMKAFLLLILQGLGIQFFLKFKVKRVKFGLKLKMNNIALGETSVLFKITLVFE